jgi:sugar phosphate isomerase/epimerase
MKANNQQFLIGSVCLERNRWGNRRVPSFAVSDWLPRFKADGFDGVELWQFHYTLADDSERVRLTQAAEMLPIYNSYIGFEDADAPARGEAVAVIDRLGARGVKYNLGRKPELLPEYRRNLLAWADALPASCRMLCECHPGTVLETPEAAVSFFADLDPERFGVIVHVGNPDTGSVSQWFDAFGQRVCHLHVQCRSVEFDPETPAGKAALDASMAVVKSHGFKGSVTLEFTRGIGRDETIEDLYANVCKDMRYCRRALASRHDETPDRREHES